MHIALAKAKPGEMFYASSAAPMFVATELFKKQAGVNIIHVPYKGSALSVTAAVAGEVPLVVVSVAPALQQLRAGKLRPLAVTSLKRDSLLPDVPTVSESGLSRREKRRKGGSEDESVKPIIGVQPVQVRSGQSRSGQAGSECCHLPGDWQVRSVHSKEAGREDSAPTSFVVAMPTPLA